MYTLLLAAAVVCGVKWGAKRLDVAWTGQRIVVAWRHPSPAFAGAQPWAALAAAPSGEPLASPTARRAHATPPPPPADWRAAVRCPEVEAELEALVDLIVRDVRLFVRDRRFLGAHLSRVPPVACPPSL